MTREEILQNAKPIHGSGDRLMRKVKYFDNVVGKCRYFNDRTDVNNGYGCNHPEQKERDDGQGKCYCWSCPLGYPADEESLSESDLEWEDGKPEPDEMEENSYIILIRRKRMKYKVGDKFLMEIEVGRIEEGSITPYKMLPTGEGWSEVALDELNRPDITAEEAWEIARKIALQPTHGGYNVEELKEIFGVVSYSMVLNSHTAQEAKDKIRAWEKKEAIKVGDVVRADSTKAVVLGVNDQYLNVWVDDGCVEEWYKSKVTKTGRHINIQNVLEQIRQEE